MDVGLQREWEKMLIVRDEVNKVCYYRQKKQTILLRMHNNIIVDSKIVE
jgi:hypothetical protein